MISKLVVVGVFVLQTVLVFGGNSRLFGLLQPGSGWYTNVEMSQRYASLVTPARFAFAIWGIIYSWEIVALIYLALRPTADGMFWKASNPNLWLAANFFQGIWALLFATERLLLAALALAGIAASLTCLAFSMRAADTLEYWLVAAPLWLHAGWTTAASIVNINLVLSLVSDAATQCAAAHASAFVACFVGLGIVVISSGDSSSCSVLVATPLVAALCWALSAIRIELKNPDLITSSVAYKEIGEVGRNALEIVVGGCAIVLASGSLLIVLVQIASGRGWLELK
uniref:Uncharacterized protein n=1 Tax=Haptolina ericina TaxID=156174 RepID=A0A7S3BY82_9EUKA